MPDNWQRLLTKRYNRKWVKTMKLKLMTKVIEKRPRNNIQWVLIWNK